ncbi:nicotinate-nucleotide--dimethylbenzimidazole phosphoribosyltransferase [Oribacterium sp. P9]|uniref:nicotinate-nucleotide--dimethylbenzimidazole phosphoribosyltransferase n=1 Tax=Oribacterium sp. P9 TaxID=3378068 RepID=UPI0039675F39
MRKSMKRDIDQQKMDHAGHTVHEEYEKYAGTSSQGCDAVGTRTHECAGDREYYRSLAQQHWDSLGKPIDSLGVLEQHVTKLCMIERTAQPHITRRALAVLCADHGCVRGGVTQTDSSVTRIVAENFARGLTTTSVLAQQFAVDLFPIDVGMLSAGDSRSSGVPADDEIRATSSSQISASSGPMPTSAALRTDRVNDRCLQHGSGDIAIEPAMSEEVGERALALGRRLVRELKAQGYDILLTGEMGIGNTTPTSALFSAYLGLPVEETVGRGAGLSDEGLERKRDCVRRALRRVNYKNAKQLLFELGGLEIATMAGMFLGAVEEQMPIVIDGAISTAAALAASRILAESNASDTTNSATVATVSASKPEQMSNPEVKRIAESAADALPDFEIHASVADVTLASHVSKDGAARKALEALGLRAIIDADMSLGEGSGAVLLLPLLDAALAVYRGMGSFDDIHVEAYQRFK